jgi:glycosyltransferase involved in cell wall biosynthesis
MLGWIAKDELGSWMTRARCLVFPSLWYEGYPLVVADALRAGVPVIVSKSSIAASSISDGVNGIHVAAGDIRAWAEAMTRLNSDDLVHRFGQAAFRAGKQLLDYDEYMSRLMGIYEKALSRKRGDAEQGGDIVP